MIGQMNIINVMANTVKDINIVQAASREGFVPIGDQKFLPIYRIGKNWFAALPLRSLFLMTHEECIEHISEMVNINGPDQEWQIAEFEK